MAYILVAFGAFVAFNQVDNVSGCAACVFLRWVCLVVVCGGDPTFFGDDCAAFTAKGFTWH